MKLVTKKSNPMKPVRVMIYSAEGVGKSTFGAKSDHPVFITPEGGVDRLTDTKGDPCEYIPDVSSWDGIMSAIKSLLIDEHNFKTLVLDSADWIEGIAHQKIIGTSGKSITTVNGGYGAGYRQSQTMHQELIKLLDELIEKKGMNIVITAHAHVKDVKDPEIMVDYQAFEIKCHEFVSSVWREWVDALLFARFKTYTSNGEDTKKARAFGDGTRSVCTVKKPAFQAKNRFGMPEELEFTEDFWNTLIGYAKNPVKPTIEKVISDLTDLSNSEKLADKKDALSKAMSDANGDLEKLIKIRNYARVLAGEE